MLAVDLPPIQEDIPAEVWEMTNEYREAHGLIPLAFDSELAKAAQARAERLVATHEFTHSGFGNEIPKTLYAAGLPIVVVGENLYCGPGGVTDVMNGWLNSIPHQSNMLDTKFKSLGVAIAVGSVNYGKCSGKSSLVVVQLLGSA